MDAPENLGRGRDKRFALLIDADNVSAKYIKPILNELNKYGTVTYKRIYGDWTLTLHAKWKDALLENSITPIQQFSYTYGKNSTDSAMIIDAMDILYGGGVEGFCIVSSDSDFTRLASRLRESGHTVIGMGEKKTPTPFRKACDIFTVLELLVKNERPEKSNGPAMSKAEVEQAVVDIIIDNQNNGKATGLGEIGSRLQKRYPDFDVRNYGTNLLSKLLGEFTRVKITKDHSSVAVELTDAGETEKAAGSAEAPRAEEAHEAVRAEEGAAQVEGATAEGEGDAEAASAERKPARRSRRSRKIRASRAEEAAAGEQPAENTEAEAVDEAKVEGEAEAVATIEPAAGEESPGSEPAEPATRIGEETPVAEETVKPARKPRRRRKAKADTGAETAPAAESAAEPEANDAEPKPAKADSPAAEPETARDAEDIPPAAEKPAKVTRKPRRKKKAEAPAPVEENTPASFIRKAIVAAGAEGIALTQLGEDVRGEFKDFKVRDLGYAQLRLYIASIDDFELVKDGKALRAKLRAL